MVVCLVLHPPAGRGKTIDSFTVGTDSVCPNGFPVDKEMKKLKPVGKKTHPSTLELHLKDQGNLDREKRGQDRPVSRNRKVCVIPNFRVLVSQGEVTRLKSGSRGNCGCSQALPRSPQDHRTRYSVGLHQPEQPHHQDGSP